MHVVVHVLQIHVRIKQFGKTWFLAYSSQFHEFREFIGLINYFSINESNLFLFGVLPSLCFKCLNIALITYQSTNK